LYQAAPSTGSAAVFAASSAALQIPTHRGQATDLNAATIPI
jgi:hypothetical protein